MGVSGIANCRVGDHQTTRPGHLGDCSHVHCRSDVENHIDTLVRQLSKNGVRPAATESQPTAHMTTDRQLIDRRDELARMLMDGPLKQPAPNIGALDHEVKAMAERLGTSGARAQLVISLGERDDALKTLERRERWIDKHAHLQGEYTEVRQEIDQRGVALALL